MPRSPGDAANGAEVHLVLYDGVCGLCNRLIQFLLVHDHREVFKFASLQSPTGHALVDGWGGNPRDLTTFYAIANYGTPRARAFTKSRAALFVAGELGWPWKALCALGVLPTLVLDPLYDLVARHRYRLFGRSDECLVPAQHVRNRFVD